MVRKSGRKALKFYSDTDFSYPFIFIWCLVLKLYLHLMTVFYKSLHIYIVASYSDVSGVVLKGAVLINAFG